MPHYIEFASNSSDPGLLGSPTYLGVPDPRIELDGIRVDGEEITFLSPSIVGTLHRALVDGPKLVRRGGRGFDCVAFALLMCGVDLVQAVGKKEFHVVSDTDDGEGVTDDTRQAYPLAIGEWPRWRNQPHYFHTIIPAHTTEGPLYLHKLADAGPICLSGIRRAQRIVEGDQLARVTSMTVNVGRRTVAEWRHDAGRR